MDEIGMIALRQPITPRRTRVLPTSQAATELAPSRDGELIGAQMPGHAASATHARFPLLEDGAVTQNVSAYGIVEIAAVGSRWHTHMHVQASNRAMHPLYTYVCWHRLSRSHPCP